MFPYPSGAGLHVGHPLGYIATDVVAPLPPDAGKNVLHSLGYDAFGLPAEQYAVQTGQHPRKTTEDNIVMMARQLRRLGLGHDDRRAIATIDPDYYRWTQWIFLQIYDSWYDAEAVRPTAASAGARPIAELVEEYRSAPARCPPTTAAAGPTWRRRAAPASSTATGWPTPSRRRSTGAPAWARCCPTRRSPTTAAPSAATSRCSSATCASG